MGLLGPLKERIHRWKLAGRDPRDVFTTIYFCNKWGDPESRSGKGSNMVATEKIRVPERMIDKAVQGLRGSSEDRAMGVWRIADLPDLRALEEAGS